MLRECQNHNMDTMEQMQQLMRGLKVQTRMFLDASAGSTMKNKNEDEAKEFIDNMC